VPACRELLMHPPAGLIVNGPADHVHLNA
jgi:hypothetical protein